MTFLLFIHDPFSLSHITFFSYFRYYFKSIDNNDSRPSIEYLIIVRIINMFSFYYRMFYVLLASSGYFLLCYCQVFHNINNFFSNQSSSFLFHNYSISIVQTLKVRWCQPCKTLPKFYAELLYYCRTYSQETKNSKLFNSLWLLLIVSVAVSEVLS